jgi:hypothetical protein
MEALIPYDWCTYLRRKPEHRHACVQGRPCEDLARRKPEKEASEETKPANTLI